MDIKMKNKQIVKSEEDYNNHINYLANILDEVLLFEIGTKVKYIFKTEDKYRKCLDNFKNRSDNNHSLQILHSNFNYTKHFYAKFIGFNVRVNGKRIKHVKDIMNIIKDKSEYFRFIQKRDAKFKSGKKFSHPSFILIKEDKIEEVFSIDFTNLKTSKLFSKESRDLIFKHILKVEDNKIINDIKTNEKLQEIIKDIYNTTISQRVQNNEIPYKIGNMFAEKFGFVKFEQNEWKPNENKDFNYYLDELNDTFEFIDNCQYIDLDKDLIEKDKNIINFPLTENESSEYLDSIKDDLLRDVTEFQSQNTDNKDILEALDLDLRKNKRIDEIHKDLKNRVRISQIPSSTANIFSEKFGLPMFENNCWIPSNINEKESIDSAINQLIEDIEKMV